MKQQAMWDQDEPAMQVLYLQKENARFKKQLCALRAELEKSKSNLAGAKAAVAGLWVNDQAPPANTGVLVLCEDRSGDRYVRVGWQDDRGWHLTAWSAVRLPDGWDVLGWMDLPPARPEWVVSDED